MWLKCIFYGLALASSTPMAAQAIPTSRILRSVEADMAVRYHTAYADLVKNTPQHLPFAEDISLRTETDRFDASRQEYLARLSVNGFHEIRETKALSAIHMQSAAQELQITWHEGLVHRYEAIANYYFAMRAYTLQTELGAVYDDRFLVLQKLASARPGETADDLIRTEFNRDEVRLELARDSISLLGWRQQLQLWIPDLGDSWILDTSDFISMEKISTVMSAMPVVVSENPYVGEKQTDIARVQQQYNLARASSNQILEFVQLRYSNSPSQPFRNDIGVGLGITLPFRGSSKPKMANLVIEQGEADMQLRILTGQLENEIAQAKNVIAARMAQYTQAMQQWTDSQARFTLSQRAQSQPDGPITMLRARELQLQRQLHLLDIEKEIVDNYLLILDLTGYLSAEPRINYLAETMNNW